MVSSAICSVNESVIRRFRSGRHTPLYTPRDLGETAFSSGLVNLGSRSGRTTPGRRSDTLKARRMESENGKSADLPLPPLEDGIESTAWDKWYATRCPFLHFRVVLKLQDVGSYFCERKWATRAHGTGLGHREEPWRGIRRFRRAEAESRPRKAPPRAGGSSPPLNSLVWACPRRRTRANGMLGRRPRGGHFVLSAPG